MASTSSWLTAPAWMSLWDEYLAPGDVRAVRQRREAFQQSKAPADVTPPPLPAIEQPKSTRPSTQRLDASHRRRRQNALFFGGLAFTGLSAFVTRRALLRKRLPFPKTFSPSNEAPKDQGAGALDALQALNLATMNVFSVAMTAVGAGAIYFDIADLGDLRESVRKGVGFDVYAGDTKADKEIEGWIAEVLASKEGGFKEGIAKKLEELQKQDEQKGEK